MQWYLARIERYNGIYRAIEYVDGPGALKIAAREDAEARAGGRDFKPAPMWGVPIVIKANTSVEGLVTSDGWKGYRIPGHELVAPADATVVRKLKAAGAVIIGQTNMPDFAASDTNRSSAFGRTGNAYDVRFSPGGSSGGTVTAVTANLAMLGTGTEPATPFECRPRRAPWWACFRRAGWSASPASPRSIGSSTTPGQSREPSPTPLSRST